MPTKRFISINGKVIGEISGGVRTNYAHDALGSVTGTIVGASLQNPTPISPLVPC